MTAVTSVETTNDKAAIDAALLTLGVTGDKVVVVQQGNGSVYLAKVV